MTETLPANLLQSVKELAEHRKTAKGYEVVVQEESFRMWAWFAAGSLEQFEEMCRMYREIVDVPKC